MKFIAILDENFLSNFRRDYDGLILVVQDKNGLTRAVRLKPLQQPVLAFPDGENIYLTQAHIDALCEYEQQVMTAEAVREINRRIQEVIDRTGETPDIQPISIGRGCEKCPSHIRCADAFQIHSHKCNHYNKTEEEFKAWLKGKHND